MTLGRSDALQAEEEKRQQLDEVRREGAAVVMKAFPWRRARSAWQMKPGRPSNPTAG